MTVSFGSSAGQWPFLSTALPIFLDAAVKSALVLAAAGLAVGCMRKCSAAARHLVWFLAVASLPLLPLLSLTLPAWHILPRWLSVPTEPIVEQPAEQFAKPRLEPTAASTAPSSPPAEVTAPIEPVNRSENFQPPPVVRAELPSVKHEAAPVEPPPPPQAPLHRPVNIWSFVLPAWIFGTAMALLPVGLGLFSLWRLERSSRRETARSWLELLFHLVARLNLKRAVALLKTDRRRMPMTWGILRPKLLLPEQSHEWSEERRRVVMLHELAHAKRWDYLTNLITQLACALYWFNPLVWFAARQMVAERERACDDIVLHHGAKPADYAEQILQIAAGLRVAPFATYAGIPMARPSKLEGRLRAILDRTRNRAALTRLVVIGTLALLTAIVIPVAMMRAAPEGSPKSETRTPNTNPILVTSAATNVPPLERTVSLNARQMPLKDALAELCRQAKVELNLDEEALKSAGASSDLPVTFSSKEETLESALWGLLNSLRFQGFWECRYEMRGQTLFVGTQAELERTRAKTMRALPDWLKLLQGRGVNAAVDEDGNVISLFAGDRATDEFLANARTLPKLREVRIQGVNGITLGGLAHLGEFPALETLQLWSSMPHTNAGWGDDALRFVSRVKTLRDLEISRCGVTDAGARALKTMTQLRALNLSGNPLTEAALPAVAGLTNLQKLDLGFGISGVGLRQLSSLSNLEELHLYASGIAGRFIAFPRLRVLSVSGEHFEDADFDGLVQCRELRRLEIAGISDAGLRRISELPELRQLDVYSEAITDAGLAHLKALPKLERLSIRTRQGDESLRHLSEIKSLVELEVYGPRWLGVEGQQKLTVEGLLQLKKLPKLRSLTIYGIQAATGVLGLRELTQLRSLTLNGYNITDKELDLLKRAMPGTYVGSMFGSGTIVLAGERRRAQEPLPTASVFLSGRVLDNATGESVTNGVFEFGAADPGRPEEVAWGPVLPAPLMEVSGNNPDDVSQFWGESFRTGKVWARILAAGYAPELLTLEPAEAPLRLTNLVARMKPGSYLRGVVVDHTGRPAAGIGVYLADTANFFLANVRARPDQGGNTTTDANGRFALAGGNGTEQRVVAASPDGQLFAVAPKVDPTREVMISLPQPATLIVRYDIPDDAPVARINLHYETQNLDPTVWTNLSFGLRPVVTNGQETVLTNLTPGTYRLIRGKTGMLGNRRGGGPIRSAILDMRTITLEPGGTQRVDIVRTRGHSIRGELMGLRATGAPGASIYAFSAGTTNDLVGMLSGRQRPIDLVTCSNDGQFVIGRLEPGAYTIVAVVELDLGWGVPRTRPDYVGAVEVNINADGPPPEPLKIELLPWAVATNQPAALSNRQSAEPDNPLGSDDDSGQAPGVSGLLIEISLGTREITGIEVHKDREWKYPLSFQVKNIGRTNISGREIVQAMSEAALHIRSAAGAEQLTALSKGFRYVLIPNDLSPGETYRDPTDGDLLSFFPSITNGTYDVWWTLGNLKSNPLRFNVANGELTLVTEPNAGNVIILPQPISTTEQAASNPETEWGQPVRGVQVRLHAIRTRWATNEEPELFVGIANRGTSRFHCPNDYRLWDLEVDGRWYTTLSDSGWGWGPESTEGPNAGETLTNLPFSLGTKRNPQMFQLPAGKHILRVKIFGFLGQPSPDFQVQPGFFLQATSNPVEVEITAPPSSSQSAMATPARTNLQSSLTPDTTGARVLTGKVIDVETRQPIPDFTVTPGSTGAAPDILPWRPEESVRGTNGLFRIIQQPMEALKIEAPGYMPEMVYEYKMLTNELVQLHRGEFVTGRVLGLDGRPVTGAQIALHLAHTEVHVSGTNLSSYLSTLSNIQSSPFTTTDARGEFKLPAGPGMNALIASSEEGFASVKLDRYENSKTIQLEPWGKVVGTLRSGDQPMMGKSVRITAGDYAIGRLGMWAFDAHASTDAEGRFSYDRVPSGEASISYEAPGLFVLRHFSIKPGSIFQSEMAIPSEPWANRTPRTGEQIVWGPETNGIQFGISSDDTSQPRTAGEKLTVNFWVRNSRPETIYATNYVFLIPMLFKGQESIVPQRVPWPFELTRRNSDRSQLKLRHGDELLFKSATVEIPNVPPGTYTLKTPSYYRWLEPISVELSSGELPIQIVAKPSAEPHGSLYEEAPAAANLPSSSADQVWGEAANGLRTRVWAETNVFCSGQPIPLKLEVTNITDAAKSFQTPAAPWNNGLTVLDARGNPVPYIAGSAQVAVPPVNLSSHHAVEAKGFDLTDYYYVRSPGRYTVTWKSEFPFLRSPLPGSGEQMVSLPPSAPFAFEVVQDPTADADSDPIGKLLPLLKDKWSIGTGGARTNRVRPGANHREVAGRLLTLQYNPTGLKNDSGLVWLWLTEEAAAEAPATGDWPPATEYLGKLSRWHVYFNASTNALRAWPTVRGDVERALSSEPAQHSAQTKHSATEQKGSSSAATTDAAPFAAGFAPEKPEAIPPRGRKVSLAADRMPLKDALAAVCREANIELELDRDAFEFEGLSIEKPVTVTLVDEPLESAVATILDRLPWDHFIFQSMRGERLLVSGHRIVQERTRRALPDWLRPLYNNGLVLKLDDDRNVVSISVGEKADDEFLEKLKTLPRLGDLDIEATKSITPAGLAHLAELPALERLHLYQVNTDGAGLGDDALRVVTRIRTLRDLDIGECSVTDDGVRALEGMTQLTSLSLSGNRLTDAAMKSLAGLTNLQRLDLNGTSWVHSRMHITDAGLKQLSRLTELRELFVGNLPVSEDALSLPHLRSLGRYRPVSEPALKNPYVVPEILDTPGWGEAVEGFQVRLRAPEATVRAGTIPRLLVDVANQGWRELRCTTNSWCWQLEVDGISYVADGTRYPGGGSFPGGDGPLYSESGGVLLDVLPGRPWANLPLTLNVAWRTADTRDLAGRFSSGTGGPHSPGFRPQPLRLTPGKHTIRLSVLGLPKYDRSGGPVLAVSKPIVIQIAGQNSSPSATSDGSEWGEAQDSISVHLESYSILESYSMLRPASDSGSAADNLPSALRLKLGVRNRRTNNVEVSVLYGGVFSGGKGFGRSTPQEGQLEVDGTWYAWTWPYRTHGPLMAGAGAKEFMEVTTGNGWWNEDLARLISAPGTHIVRLAVWADGSSGPRIHAVSNPVEIEGRALRSWAKANAAGVTNATPDTRPPGETNARPHSFVVTGRVTDEQGKGLEGVTLTAHCGMGTLFPTGETNTDANGYYVLQFREGMKGFNESNKQWRVMMQAATISPRKASFSEANLHRGGDLLMADKLPAPGEDVGWKVDPAKVVLPNQPYELNFVMRPAATVSGILRDEQDRPMAKTKLWINGEQLPPSSSVLAEAETDPEGRFRFENVPVGYLWRFNIKDKPGAEVRFAQPGEHSILLRVNKGVVELAQRISEPPLLSDFYLGMTEAKFKEIAARNQFDWYDNSEAIRNSQRVTRDGEKLYGANRDDGDSQASAEFLFAAGKCIRIDSNGRERYSPADELPAQANDDVLRDCLSSADLVVTGEIASDTGPASDGHHLEWYLFKFKIARVLKGAAAAGDTIAASAEHVLPTEFVNPLQRPTFKKSDRLLLFLKKLTPGPGDRTETRWITSNRTYGALRAGPDLESQVKRLAGAGRETAAEPAAPFNQHFDPSRGPRTKLDIRISAVTNLIAPVPFTNHYGFIMYSLGLPVRVENHSSRTFTATVPHIRHLGPLPRTDVGAAVKQIGDPSSSWRRNDVCLVDESADPPTPTVWRPGESHEFNLYLNWPGTNALPAGPLIRSTTPGKYAVRVSLTFQSEGRSEYAVSPELEIRTLAEPAITEAAPHPTLVAARQAEPGWGESVEGISVRLQPDKLVWESGETPAFKVSVHNLGSRRPAIGTAQKDLGEFEVDGVSYFWDGNERQGSALSPGQQRDSIAVSFTNRWYTKLRRPLLLSPGKHTVRFAVVPDVWFSPVAGRRDPSMPGDLRIFSNPVEIELRTSEADYAAALREADGPDELPRSGPVLAEFSGHVVDDVTGAPVTNIVLQSGMANPQKPDEITWSQMFLGPWLGKPDFFSVQTWKRWETWRVLADGYLPQQVIAPPHSPSAQANDLIVRLKRGGELRGVVLDHAGKPVPDAKVVLNRYQTPRIVGSRVQPVFGGSTAITDASGQFRLQGVSGNESGVVVMARELQFWSVSNVVAGQELRITLPEPAALTVRYDIPGDAAEGELGLRLFTTGLGPLHEWDALANEPKRTVPNGGVLTVTNLAPGSYDVYREKRLNVGDVSMGVPCDYSRFVLESGQSKTIEFVRATGYPVHGEVIGLTNTEAAGALIYVRSAEATGDPRSAEQIMMRRFDALTCGTDGQFQTARLDPGAYTIAAEVYRPETPEERGRTGIRAPAYVGTASVTVSADTAPPPVRIELRPWTRTAQAPQASVGASFPLGGERD